MRIRTLILLVILALVMAGCSAARPSSPATPPPDTPTAEAPTMTIEGVISNVQPAAAGGEILGTIRVEGEKNPNNEYDRAELTISKDTVLRSEESGTSAQVGFDALEFGQFVKARFVGPVLESYPVQARAVEVVIIR
ncbi:MAG: hypothetical protein QME94_06685, partial [Anaerolineae bacterium]|nr:hypothetical protein [Anaerolineae bacterium]